MSAPRDRGDDANDGESDDDGEWRFDLSDLEDEGTDAATRPPIEPGSPSVENVVFVLLGVALTVWMLFGGV